jgi:hypothetical protein
MARSHPEGMSFLLAPAKRGDRIPKSWCAAVSEEKSEESVKGNQRAKKDFYITFSEGSVVQFSEPLSLQRVPKVLPRRVSKYQVVRPHKCQESDDHWSKSFTQQTRKFWYVLVEQSSPIWKKDLSNSPEKSRSETWSRNHRSLLTIGRKAV